MLVAHNQVLNWINTVINEVDGYKKFYDVSQSRVRMDLKVLQVTTTSSTTVLTTTTTDFWEVWGTVDAFAGYRNAGTIPPDLVTLTPPRYEITAVAGSTYSFLWLSQIGAVKAPYHLRGELRQHSRFGGPEFRGVGVRGLAYLRVERTPAVTYY